MPSSESRPGAGTPEQEPRSYQRAAHFFGERPAGRAYSQARNAIFAAEDCDLSVFRVQFDRDCLVAVLGEPPPAELDRQLERILSRGDPATLSAEMSEALTARRAEMTKLGPWVERQIYPSPDDQGA